MRQISSITKQFIYILSITSILILQGCGGDGTPTDPDPIVNPDTAGDPDPNVNPDPVVTPNTKTDFKYDRITIAGSSITQGEGYLGEDSYVGYVEKHLRENIADTIGPDELLNADESINEPMSYQGVIKVYNAGTQIRGTLKASDELSIVYASSDVNTVVEMEVEDQVHTYTIPAGTYTPVKRLFETDGFYKAFRETDDRAVKTWKLSNNEDHNFTLHVKKGKLHLNFITNHMYYMQNAGVAGFEANDFLRGGTAQSTIKEIIAFNPDLFILESSTNDAKTWKKELALKANPTLDAPSTNNWILEDPTDFTANGNQITLNQAVNVEKDDIVIIGEYSGDIQSMVVGIVSEDSNNGTITLSKIVSYQGKTVTELTAIPENIIKKCRIKNVKLWETRIKEVVSRLNAGLNHDVKVGIGTSGVPNYYHPEDADLPQVSGIYDDTDSPRGLLGYRERGKMIAKENGWFFVDFFQSILKVEPGVDTTKKWSKGDNTHPKGNGLQYFGEAVVDALEDQ